MFNNILIEKNCKTRGKTAVMTVGKEYLNKSFISITILSINIGFFSLLCILFMLAE